jgi:hypothetical protein
VATWDDVRRIVESLPELTERPGQDGAPGWRVKDKLVAWERPLRRADLEALGDSAPDGPILGVRTPDVAAKHALLADDPGIYFTTPHFEGYPAVLVRLDEIPVPDLEELIVEAWFDRAPSRLVEEYRTR